MKRWIAGLLSLSMMLPLAACNASPDPIPENTAEGTDAVTTAAPETTAAQTTAETTAADTAETKEEKSVTPFDVTPREKADPSVTRSLAENVLTAAADSEIYAILDVDNLTGKLARVLTDKQTKLHSKSFMWSYRNMPSLSFVPKTPDLSMYEGFSFWMYADENAVGQTFVLNLNSENKASEGSDYYTTNTVKIAEAGWTYYSWRLDRMGVSRSP